MLTAVEKERLQTVIARRDQQFASDTRRAAMDGQGHQKQFGSDEITPREIEVLIWMAEGCQNDEISQLLGISIETVKSHVRHIFVKVDAHTRAHAVAIALRSALIA